MSANWNKVKVTMKIVILWQISVYFRPIKWFMTSQVELFNVHNDDKV